MEKDGDISTSNINNTSEAPVVKKTKKTIYILLTIIFSCAALIVFGSLVLEGFKKGDKTIKSGVEQYDKGSKINTVCGQLLNKLRTGEVEPLQAAFHIGQINHPNSKLIANGIVVFDILKRERNSNKENDKVLEYTDLKMKMDGFQSILNELRSLSNIDKDSLYIALIARDLIIYIFKNRDVFSIHIEDKFISNSDKKVMRNFYQDIFSVYDYLKQLSKQNAINNFYDDVRNFDLLAIGLYVKALDATESYDNKDKIDQIINKIQSEDFNIPGVRGEWYAWLAQDLKKVKNDYNRFMVKKEPPNFVEGLWLR